MNDALSLPHNPFATRFTRPGEVPYLFPPGQDTASLVERLRTNGWWGEIVGPHGSGKSTLVAALVAALREAGRDVRTFSLHNRQRRLPCDRHAAPWNEATQLVIDGYEQLAVWQRWLLKRRCRRARCGLLVTSHRSAGLPALYQAQPDLDTCVRVVQWLAGDAPGALSRDDVASSFQRQRGNIREVLFELYDLYERRSR